MMGLLPDVEYQPDMTICPLCSGRQLVMYRYQGWGRMAHHLVNGEWCPQMEFLISTLTEPEEK
jgi:hypothetical protein